MSEPGQRDIDGAILLALASGAGVAGAARHAKCSTKTVQRRLRSKKFRAKVQAMRAKMVSDAVGRLAAVGTLAVDELFRQLKSGEGDKVKQGAARSILTFMLAGHSQETMAAEVAQLRDLINDSERAQGGNQAATAAAGESPATSDGASLPAAAGPDPNLREDETRRVAAGPDSIWASPDSDALFETER
jgi:hypothetical protein